MELTVKYFQTQLPKIDSSQTVVIAVSAGADSMALLHLMQQLPDNQRPKIVVAHVNHQLRTESQLELEMLKTYCRENQLTIEIATWSKEQQPKTGIELAARQFRYAFFKTICQKYAAPYLFTAHHGDDQIETILMKLTRSGFVSGGMGILAKRPLTKTTMLVRPLLRWDKAAIYTYVKKVKLPYFEDSTNQDATYTRNFYRQKIIPQLKKDNSQVVLHFNQFATRQFELINGQTKWAESLVAACQIQQTQTVFIGRLTPLEQLDKVQLQFFLEVILKRLAIKESLTQKQVTNIYTVIQQHQKPNSQINLAKQLIFEKNYQQFKLGFIAPVKTQSTKREALELNSWVDLPQQQIGLFELDKSPSGVMASCIIWVDKTQSFYVQQANGSERLVFNQKGQHQSVKRLWINRKIATPYRALTWLVYQGEKPIGIPWLQVAKNFKKNQELTVPMVLCQRFNDKIAL